jgi:hypothetical protein
MHVQALELVNSCLAQPAKLRCGLECSRRSARLVRTQQVIAQTNAGTCMQCPTPVQQGAGAAGVISTQMKQRC